VGEPRWGSLRNQSFRESRNVKASFVRGKRQNANLKTKKGKSRFGVESDSDDDGRGPPEPPRARGLHRTPKKSKKLSANHIISLISEMSLFIAFDDTEIIFESWHDL
jgi:hypothetical protein